jgi:hypothetical protein
MILNGSNCIILDLETHRSPSDCQICGPSHATHESMTHESMTHESMTHESMTHQYAPLGWENHAALGISLGCLYRYDTDSYQFFDQHTLEETMLWLVQTRPLVVSFNGRRLDGPLMLACLPEPLRAEWPREGTIEELWRSVWDRSYDILHEIWAATYARGNNSLDALSRANGYGAKAMDGAEAPRRWAQGRYAEVINYCMGDVQKTRRLFEQIVETGTILRGNGEALTLPRPVLP